MNMVAKGISQDDFPENGVGRWSYNYTSEEPMYCFGRFSNTFASEGSIRAKVNDYLRSSVGVVISVDLIPTSQLGIRASVYEYLGSSGLGIHHHLVWFRYSI